MRAHEEPVRAGEQHPRRRRPPSSRRRTVTPRTGRSSRSTTSPRSRCSWRGPRGTSSRGARRTAPRSTGRARCTSSLSRTATSQPVAIVARAHIARVRRCRRNHASRHTGTPTTAYITHGWLISSHVSAMSGTRRARRVSSVAARLTSRSRSASGPNSVADQEREHGDRDRHGHGVDDGARQTARSTRVPLHPSHAYASCASAARRKPAQRWRFEHCVGVRRMSAVDVREWLLVSEERENPHTAIDAVRGTARRGAPATPSGRSCTVATTSRSCTSGSARSGQATGSTSRTGRAIPTSS